MTNWGWVYLLSVCESVHDAAVGSSSTLLLVSAIAGAVRFVCFAEGHRDISDHLSSILRVIVPLTAIMGLIAVLTPSTDSLVKAYLLVEGSEIVTAENVEEVSKNLSKKADALVEALKGE